MRTWGSVSHMASAVIIQFCLCSPGAAMDWDLTNNRHQAMLTISATNVILLNVLRKSAPVVNWRNQPMTTPRLHFFQSLESLTMEATGMQAAEDTQSEAQSGTHL